MLNDYDAIAELYSKSNTKPDKLYSILPTVLRICKSIKSYPKTVFDLGCGDGFFTFALAKQYPGAEMIAGLDNSEKQIERAKEILKNFPSSIIFEQEDVFEKPLWSEADLILAPFILGYTNLETITTFFQSTYQILNNGGAFVIVLDDPKGIDNSRFGAKKSIDGGRIAIELFDENQQPITTLRANFHHKDTIAELLEKTGFRDIAFRDAIISDEGMQALGAVYWEGYRENSELCYISCIKSYDHCNH